MAAVLALIRRLGHSFITLHRVGHTTRTGPVRAGGIRINVLRDSGSEIWGEFLGKLRLAGPWQSAARTSPPQRLVGDCRMETEQLLSREFGPIIDEFDLGAFASAIGIGTGSSPATLRHAKRLMAPPARIASDAIAPPPRKTKVAGGLVPTASPAEMTTQPPPPLSVHADDEDDTTTEATSPPSVLQPARAVSSSKQKGLRHFSLIVCEKLRQLQVTTYHVVRRASVPVYLRRLIWSCQVSDELVIELTQQNGPTFLGQSGKVTSSSHVGRGSRLTVQSEMRSKEHSSTGVRCTQRSAGDRRHQEGTETDHMGWPSICGTPARPATTRGGTGLCQECCCCETRPAGRSAQVLRWPS